MQSDAVGLDVLRHTQPSANLLYAESGTAVVGLANTGLWGKQKDGLAAHASSPLSRSSKLAKPRALTADS